MRSFKYVPWFLAGIIMGMIIALITYERFA
jgi:hypothetical protein